MLTRLSKDRASQSRASNTAKLNLFIMLIATITSNRGNRDVNSVKQDLVSNMKWSGLVRSFVSQYEYLTEDLIVEVKDRAHSEPTSTPIVMIVGESATSLLQNIVRWITSTPYHVNKTMVIGGVEINIGGLRIAYRHGKYERTAADPYRPNKVVTGIYLNGGLGVKTHSLTCIARDYVALGTEHCDGDPVTAWSANSYFPPEDAEKWGLPETVFA